MGFDLAAVQEFDVRVLRGKKPREQLEKALKYRQEALRYTQMQTGFSSEKISADESSSLQWPILLGSLAFGILSFLLPVYGKRLGASALGIGAYSPSSRLQRYWSVPWSVGPWIASDDRCI